MKRITIKESEPAYGEFRKYAKTHDRTTSELIREAMEEYLKSKMLRRWSLKDLQPVWVGKILGDTLSREGLLTEMLGDDRP